MKTLFLLLTVIMAIRLHVYAPLNKLMRDPTTSALRSFLRQRPMISKETTYLTGPLLPDGSVDYVSAINTRRGNGVRFADNGMVQILQACPPKFESDQQRKRFFELIGGGIPFHKQDALEFLISSDRAFDDNDGPAWKQFRRAHEGQWKPGELPNIELWIRRNERAFKLFEAAANKPVYFLPMVNLRAAGASLPTSLGPTDRGNANDFLTWRAYSCAGAKHFNDTYSALYCVLRLSRADWNGIAGGDLVASKERTELALLATMRCLRAAAWDRAELERFSQLVPDLSMDWFNTDDRFFASRCESLMVAQARGAVGFFFEFGLSESILSTPKPIGTQLAALVSNLVANALVDINVVLRETNVFFYQIDALRKLPTFSQRMVVLLQLRKRWPTFDKCDIGLFSGSVGAGGRYFFRRAIKEGKSIQSLFLSEQMSSLLGIAETAAIGTSRVQTLATILKLEIAAHLYRVNRGRFPDAIAELVPNYLLAIPRDLMTDSPFIYRNLGKDYRLYSLGIDGIDNGGPIGSGPKANDDVGMPIE